jgi:hypothetical protein
MTVEAWFQLVEAVAVVVAVGFAMIQVRQHDMRQAREAAMELLHSFQTPEFAKAITLVYGMPDGLTKKEIEDRLGDDLHLVYAMTTTWESIGVLVFRGEISLGLVDDFFSGPITLSWNRLKNYFFTEREEQNRQTIGEWFQWLAERLQAVESVTPPVPAHIAHRDWDARRAISS